MAHNVGPGRARDHVRARRPCIGCQHRVRVRYGLSGDRPRWLLVAFRPAYVCDSGHPAHLTGPAAHCATSSCSRVVDRSRPPELYRRRHRRSAPPGSDGQAVAARPRQTADRAPFPDQYSRDVIRSACWLAVRSDLVRHQSRRPPFNPAATSTAAYTGNAQSVSERSEDDLTHGQIAERIFLREARPVPAFGRRSNSMDGN